MTITEALAELKTIPKRIEAKQKFIGQHFARTSDMVDPLLPDGGSALMVQRELQSIKDLHERVVALRVAIQKTNQVTHLKVEDTTRTIAEWLAWRKEVAPARKSLLTEMGNAIERVRQKTAGQPMIFAQANAAVGPGAPAEKHVIVNLSESELAAERELMEKILGDLDGQLSLLNATTQVVGI